MGWTTDLDDHDARLRRVLWDLQGILPEVVLIGGWVPHLYRKHGGFPEWSSVLSLTEELDVLVEPLAREPETVDVASVLKQAGFEPIDEGQSVWEDKSAEPRRIEFMTPHAGTALGTNNVVPVRGRGLGALSLEGLGVLGVFTRGIEVLVGSFEGSARTVSVRVPTLGAFVVGKAVVFPRRPPDPPGGGHPKAAKDVLYMRDIVAAGGEVVAQVEADLTRIASTEWEAQLNTARNNTYLLFEGANSKYLDEAAGMLAERETKEPAAARADLEGHVTDLLELFDEARQS